MWVLEVENVKVHKGQQRVFETKENSYSNCSRQTPGWERIICAFNPSHPTPEKKITTEIRTTWNFFLRLWHTAKATWKGELAQISALSLSGFLYNPVVYPTHSLAPQPLYLLQKSEYATEKQLYRITQNDIRLEDTSKIIKSNPTLTSAKPQQQVPHPDFF